MMSVAKMRRLEAQGGKCAYCRRAIELDGEAETLATWDEIIPRSRGGRPDRWNRVLACLPCNARKANRHVHDFQPGWMPDPLWNLAE